MTSSSDQEIPSSPGRAVYAAGERAGLTVFQVDLLAKVLARCHVWSMSEQQTVRFQQVLAAVEELRATHD